MTGMRLGVGRVGFGAGRRGAAVAAEEGRRGSGGRGTEDCRRGTETVPRETEADRRGTVSAGWGVLPSYPRGEGRDVAHPEVGEAEADGRTGGEGETDDGGKGAARVGVGSTGPVAVGGRNGISIGRGWSWPVISFVPAVSTASVGTEASPTRIATSST